MKIIIYDKHTSEDKYKTWISIMLDNYYEIVGPPPDPEASVPPPTYPEASVRSV